MEFDYKFYTNTYKDLSHFNDVEAYTHWLTFGIKEGRYCSKQLMNFETNVTIIIHLFNETLFDEFLTYISYVKAVFKLVNVIISININSEFDKIINNEYPDFIVLKLENKGVDVYPFIESVKYIRANNIKSDYILKLHTKESVNETQNLLNWRKELIEPIVDINNLSVLQHYFKNNKNIGYVGSQKCALPKNYDLDFPQNIEGLNQLCDKFPHLEKEWNEFNGGNMYWINNEVLTNYLTNELIEYLIPKFSYGKPPCNLTDQNIYVEYLCERLFSGVFCYKKTNILVNENKSAFSFQYS